MSLCIIQMSEYSHGNSRGRWENIWNAKDLVDYGERKRIGTGHRRGGTGRRRQRRSWSASDGRTGASGRAVRRAGEARYAGRAGCGSGKGSRAVGGGHLRTAGRAGQQCRLWAVGAVREEGGGGLPAGGGP